MKEPSYENYRIHYGYLRYRLDDLDGRLSMLTNWTFQPLAGTPVGDLKTWLALLEFYIRRTEQIPPSVEDFRLRMAGVVDSLVALHAATRIDRNMPPEAVIAALKLYWDRRDVVKRAAEVLLHKHPLTELALVVPDSEQMQQSIEKSVKALEAAIEVLAKPTQPDVPDDLIKWSRILSELLHKSVNNQLFAENESILIEGCRHSFSLIRRDALRLIDQYSSEATLEVILACCGDADPEVREAAIDAICNHKPSDDERIANTLVVAISDPNESVAARAIAGVRRLKIAKAVHPLITSLDREFETTGYVGWVGSALAAIPDPVALKPLIRKLDEVMQKPGNSNSIHIYPVAGLIQAIRAIGGTEAEETLSRYSFDP